MKRAGSGQSNRQSRISTSGGVRFFGADGDVQEEEEDAAAMKPVGREASVFARPQSAGGVLAARSRLTHKHSLLRAMRSTGEFQECGCLLHPPALALMQVSDAMAPHVQSTEKVARDL